MKPWNPVSIGEFGRVVTGGTPSSKKPHEFGDLYPFITPADISDNERLPSCGRFLSEVGAEAHKRIRLPKHTPCVVCIGATIGKVCLTERDSFTNQQINSIIVNASKHDAAFVYYLASVLSETLKAFAGGAATPIINKSIFSKLRLQAPALQEQKKIAAILTAYDDLIENNQRRITALEKMAEEIYREWFVRLRFPGHEKVKLVKGVPEGWTTPPASEAFVVMGGGTPKTDVAAFWDGDIPFFTPKDSHVGFYVLGTEKTLTEKGLESCSSSLFPKNTIFITARGTVGELCLAHCDMAMNQSCYALAPRTEPAVYFHFLAMKTAITYIKGISKSGVFDNIVIDTFKGVPIRMPNKNLVSEFNRIAEPVFEQIGLLLQQNTALRQTRDLLLPRLISGKLRVDKLDIQFPPSMVSSQSTTPSNANS